MYFVAKMGKTEHDAPWNNEDGKTSVTLPVFLGFEDEDPARNHVTVTIKAALKTNPSHKWHFQEQSVCEMLSTPICRVEGGGEILPTCCPLYFECEEISGIGYFSEGDSLQLQINSRLQKSPYRCLFVFDGEEWGAPKDAETNEK